MPFFPMRFIRILPTRSELPKRRVLARGHLRKCGGDGHHGEPHPACHRSGGVLVDVGEL